MSQQRLTAWEGGINRFEYLSRRRFAVEQIKIYTLTVKPFVSVKFKNISFIMTFSMSRNIFEIVISPKTVTHFQNYELQCCNF